MGGVVEMKKRNVKKEMKGNEKGKELRNEEQI